MHVILGSGLSGIYRAYMLEKSGKTDIIILEKSSRDGGRIKTHKNNEVMYECGPSKILPCHVRMLKLLKDLDLFKNLKRVRNPNPLVINLKQFKNISDSESLREMLVRHLGVIETNKLIEASGYSHVFDNDAKSGIMYLKDMTYKHFYVLTTGLESIVDVLVSKLRYTKIIHNYTVESVYGNKVNNYFEFDKLFISLPPKAFLKLKTDRDDIATLQKRVVEDIITVPLVRIYGNTKEPNYMPYKVVEDPVQRHVSLTPTFHQIVYASGKNALYWKNKTRSDIVKDISMHIVYYDIEKYYWDSGIHLRRPKSSKYSTYRSKDVICIGEAYSKYKRWMESALS